MDEGEVYGHNPEKEKYDLSNEKEFIRFMGEISIFSKLTKSERMNLKKYIYLRTFKPGEVVFKKGIPMWFFTLCRRGCSRSIWKRMAER